jgi:membrane-associated phospholipid phosphatase
MQTRLAHLLSIMLVPPTVSAAVLTALALRRPSGSIARDALIWFVAVLAAGGIQIAYVLVLRARRSVTDWDVPERRERTGPYLVSVAVSTAGFAVLVLLDAPLAQRLLLWCYSINTLVLVAINLRWKISAHLMGYTGPLIFLLPLSAPLLLVLALGAAALGWARVRLGSHTPAQVVAGALAGIFLVALQLFLVDAYGWISPALFR